jgi:alkylresorcinol/alkylpyrone synthase
VEQAWSGSFLAERFRERLRARSLRVIEKVFSHPSVRRRRFGLESPEEILDGDPDAKAARFERWSVELSTRALTKALERAGVAPGELSALVVNTCTGYLCPGISTYLIERLDLPRGLPVFDLLGGGCGGALPNLELGARLVQSAGGVVASVSVEICSATFQMGDDLALILSNALFADGASATLLWDRPQGLRLVDSARLYDPAHREHVRFVYRNGQLHNRLSLHLPRLVAQAADGVTGELLSRAGQGVPEIRHWVVHPGGERILEAVQHRLGLTDEQLAPSRAVLAEYGNLSSATAGFILEEILERGAEPGDRIVLLSYGAGLSCHGMLLEAGLALS